MTQLLTLKEAAALLDVPINDLYYKHAEWGLTTRRHPKAGVLFFRSSLMARRREIHQLMGIETAIGPRLRLVVGQIKTPAAVTDGA